VNTSLNPPPPRTPPALPVNRIPADYREKVRRYTSARRSFFGRSARRRVVALEVAALIAAIVADLRFELPETVRWAILGLMAIMGIVSLALWWWRPALALGEKQVIRELEYKVPALGQRLRTSREAEGKTCDLGMAGVFASGLVADTRVRMSGIDVDSLIPWKTIRLSLYVALAFTAAFVVLFTGWPEFRVGAQRVLAPGSGVTYTTVALEPGPESFKDHENPLIAAVVSGRAAPETTLFTREEGQEWKSQKMDAADAHGRFTALLTGLTDSFDFYVIAGDGRSELRHVRCLHTPRIEKVENEIQFPDYIGQPPQKGAGGDVKAVEDSTVTVVFQINPPLTQALIRTTDGQKLPLKIEGNHVVLEQKLTRGDTVYRLTGYDADGLALPPSNFKLTGVEDKPPEVELVEPKKDVEATTVWEILARLRAKDDYGLAEVGIVLVVGNEMKLIAHRELSEKNVRAVSEMGTAALEEFPLTINDNLKIYAFARDHKPRDGARTVSKLVSIDIRQFQVRWRLNPNQGKGGGGPPMSGGSMNEFFNLIKEQRQVVSDTFLLKENGVPSGGDLGAECEKIKTREDTATARVTKLKDQVANEGTMAADDLTLLDTAAQQMTEASGHLAEKLPRPAYKQADRALSSLLALRKEIMKLMSQSKSAMPAEAEEPPKITSMSDLAAEAARLAGEEHEVREKVTQQQPDAREKQVTQHQQEVAVTDAGELFAGIVRQPGASELALQRMEDAEKSMQKAEEQMRGAAAQEAGPELKSAEDLLGALASQLRALDEKNMEDTMGKLAQMAADAKESVEQEQKERSKGQPKGKSGDAKQGANPKEGAGQPKASGAPQDKPGANNEGAQPNGDAAGKPEGAGEQEAKAKGDDGKQGADSKEGTGQPKASGAPAPKEKPGPNGEGTQPNGDTTGKPDGAGKQDAKAKGDDGKQGTDSKEGTGQPKASGALQEKPGATGEGAQPNSDATSKQDGAGKQDGKAKGDDGKQSANAHASGAPREKAGENQARGNANAKAGQTRGAETDRNGLAKAAEDAATIDDVLKAFAGKEGAGEDGTRLAELREQARTEALKPDVQALDGEKNDAAAAGKAGELGRRFGKLADALGAEQRRLLQSRTEALTELLARTRKLEQQANQNAANGKNQDADGKQRSADGKQAAGAQEGNNAPKPEKPGDEGKGKEAANQEKKGQGESPAEANKGQPGNGDQAEHQPGSKRAGGGGGGGRADSPLGSDHEIDPNTRFLNDLDRIADDSLRGVLRPLHEDLRKGGFETSHLQPVAERLGKMLDELVRGHSEGRHASGVPDEYSHLVDEYFRALSEDSRSDAGGSPEPTSPRK
jgi:hypothetical protein